MSEEAAVARPADHAAARTGTMAVLLLFFIGLAAGIAIGQATRPHAPTSPFATLPPAGEPSIASTVATAIQSDDARSLARTMDTELLGQLGQALDPIIDVFEVRFVGAVEKSGDTLSAYVVQGRDLQGTQLLVGYVVRVRGDKVIGIN